MNDSQKAAVYSKGPTLVIAGPGTGKTYTIIQRVIHLIRDQKVKPEEIMLVTYTVKASKELTTRLTNELSKLGLDVNLHDMYLGTFHHICRMILKEFREYTTLERNFLETDQFEQQYLVYGHLSEFEKIPGFDTVVSPGYMNRAGIFHSYSPWKRCQSICHYVSGLAEELLDPEEMRRQHGHELEGRVEVLARMLMKYNRFSREENFIDYTRLQTETYHLLQNYPSVRHILQKRIQYIMIDEYQDTDYIQEALIQLLLGHEKHIFVVGDDDQSIYRFRGATVGNILGFAKNYHTEGCQVFKLDTNYRSTQGIIDFCGQWMTRLYPKRGVWKKEGEGYYRYVKGKMKSGATGVEPSVVKVTDTDYKTWLQKVAALVKQLKQEGEIEDYNQVAILWSSVKSYIARDMQIVFEREGIPVYAPRAGHFFERKEVSWLLGCLLYLFPAFSEHMEAFPEMGETEGIMSRYLAFLSMARYVMEQKENQALKHWLDGIRSQIRSEHKLPFSLLQILYHIISFTPFSKWMDEAAKGESGEARNISAITRLISRFRYFLKEGNGKSKENVEECYLFFYRYLRLWYENRVDEYEDEERYAPSGKVSFLNIHQSKGLEYPVVIVASLDDTPWGDGDYIPAIVQCVTSRKSYEPAERWNDLDFLRKYYTAFSRAETLLVLASQVVNGKKPSRFFLPALQSIPSYDEQRIPLEKMHFRPVQSAHFKPRFSYTTQVALYEICPLQYKWKRIYGFASHGGTSMMFGLLVHETLEDIHKAVARGEEETISPGMVYGWLMSNYSSLSKREHIWLSKKELDRAYQEVMGYVQYRKENWSAIKEAEVPLELVKDTYIMDGTIDLLQGKGQTMDIMDFKTGKKPSMDSPLMERYRGQLEVYAYLVERKLGQSIGQLVLYFTGSDDPVVVFPYTQEHMVQRIEQFDETVEKILAGDFYHKVPYEEREKCQFCDWKFYCWHHQEEN